jgi:sporulation protein YlmC with PRC-barrel domain
MNKAVFFAAALLLTPLPALGELAQQQTQDKTQTQQPKDQPGDRDTERDTDRDSGRFGEDLLERLSKSDLRERIASAVERIENACGEDIERFCSEITPGGGRIASCVQAYSDQLSRRCQFVLRRTVNRVQQAVETIADTCMSAVKQQCGDSGNVKQCVQQKSASLPQSCQVIVAVVQHVGRGQAANAEGEGTQGRGAQRTAEQNDGGQGLLAHLRGMPVFSSDGKNLGQIVQVERAPDGKIQSVQLQVGRLLGLGDKVVSIDGSRLEQLADRVRVMMNSDQVRSLPEAKSDASPSGSAQR